MIKLFFFYKSKHKASFMNNGYMYLDVNQDIEHIPCECSGIMRKRYITLGSFFFEDLESVSDKNINVLQLVKFVRILVCGLADWA